MTATAADRGPGAQVFAGLKVADFTWAAAGPIATKQLADNGATVVKVESLRHPDSVRLGGPYVGDRPGVNRSGFFADFNSSKLSISVDMRHPRAREVIEPLVRWADVAADSFRPGVMARWGFGYEHLRGMNPRLIVLSSSLYGASGPWSEHPGYGAQGAALAGVHGMTGWPDRPPASPKGAYTDSVSARFAAAALVAALIHRERTGEGQFLELSQIETTVVMVTPELISTQLGGPAQVRSGNAVPHALLYGVFPCRGDDRWIAIEVWDGQTWDACLSVLDPGRDGAGILREDPDARSGRRDEVEAAIGALTCGWDPFDLMGALRSAGVAAGVALRGSDLFGDENLKAREHFRMLSHPEMGDVAYNGPAYRFEATPSVLRSAAPCLGADTRHVLGELLKMDSARIQELNDAGVLY